MEIKYERSYASPKGRYTAGKIGAALGCALEIADPRAPMAEGALEPGESCMLLFGLTPEEYAWRESDPARLDELAKRLRAQIPADRLIAWRVCDLKGAAVARAVKPKTGESVDGGAFVRMLRERTGAGEVGPLDRELKECRRLQTLCAQKDAAEALKAEECAAREALGRALLGLEKIYVAEDALLNGRWPSVGYDGRIELFTLPGRAERARKRIAEVNGGVELWTIREIPHDEIEASLRAFGGNGLTALRVDNGFAAAELKLEDVLDAVSTQNAPLRSMLLREVEYGARWKRLKEAGAPEPNQRGALESMLSLQNFARREIGRARLYALCAGPDDRGVACVNLSPDGKRYLAVFTDRLRAVAFAGRIQGDAHAKELTFDELARRAETAEGMLIDASEIGYRLPKAAFDKVRELREKPPLMVRIQPPKPVPKPETGLPNPDEAGAKPNTGLPNPDEAGAKPNTGLPNPDEVNAKPDTGLPNPDETNAVPKPDEAETKPEDAVQEPNAAQTSARAAKKGLLRRLFGK